MKTALMSLVVLASLNAFAAPITLNYDIGAPMVVTSQYGVEASDLQFCPLLDAMTIQQEQDLTATALTFTQQRGLLMTKATGATRGCMSDILCPADDNFKFLTIPGSASITRNNDGNYPTTDLPGYSALSVYLEAPTKTGHVSCYYEIKASN